MNRGTTGVDIPRWYVIHTKSREEMRANNNLMSWKIETFCPLIKEQRVNAFTGRSTPYIKSLFPRYIFARFEASKLLQKIYFTRGVHRVVSFGDCPIPVDDEAIAVIRSRMDEDGFVTMNDDIEVGDEVVIKDGPLKGFTGIFDRRTKNAERVRILLTTIHYQVSIVVNSEQIEKSSPITRAA